MAPDPVSPWDSPSANRVPPDLRSSSTVTTLSSSSHSRSPRSSHSRSPRISNDRAPPATSPRPPKPTPHFEPVDDDDEDDDDDDDDDDDTDTDADDEHAPVVHVDVNPSIDLSVNLDDHRLAETHAAVTGAPPLSHKVSFSVDTEVAVVAAAATAPPPPTAAAPSTATTNPAAPVSASAAAAAAMAVTPASPPCHLPVHALVDGVDSPSTPSSSAGNQPLSSRTLPRCGVVNFQKDGDNLRWAPRVTHNASGVAARVHNFEDAFSLEEFSSTALPVLWQSKGGNPRVSGLDRVDPASPRSAAAAAAAAAMGAGGAGSLSGAGGRLLYGNSRRPRDRIALSAKHASASQPSSPRARGVRMSLDAGLPSSSPSSRAGSPGPRRTGGLAAAAAAAAVMTGKVGSGSSNGSNLDKPGRRMLSASTPSSPKFTPTAVAAAAVKATPSSPMINGGAPAARAAGATAAGAPSSGSPSAATARRFKSVSPVRSVVKSDSVKRTIALANELRRPSFWSLLAHTKKYQKAKARARLHAEDTKRLSRGSARASAAGAGASGSGAGREGDSVVLRRREGGSGAATAAHPALRNKRDDGGGGASAAERPWIGLSSMRRNGRAGRGSVRGGSVVGVETDGRRSGSLFKKFVEHLERRNAASEMAAESDTGDRARALVRSEVERSEGRAIRTRSRWGQVWSSSDGGQRMMNVMNGRRTKSTLQAEGGGGGDGNGGDEAGGTVANVQEDQYLTFITSVV